MDTNRKNKKKGLTIVIWYFIRKPSPASVFFLLFFSWPKFLRRMQNPEEQSYATKNTNGNMRQVYIALKGFL